MTTGFTLASLLRRVAIASLLLTAGLPCWGLPHNAPSPQARPAAAPNPSEPGYYYALVIGVDNYKGLPALHTAANDATAVEALLRDRYGFIVRHLINAEATHDAILEALVSYQAGAGPNDSLLIYYAGHGYLDADANKAYWLPADADSTLSPHRIIADEITNDLRALRARHVLVISDSCYSGGLSRDPGTPFFPSKDPGYLAKMMARQSRHLMASGGEEPVADGGKDGHSVFAYTLIQALANERDAQFSASSLFEDVIRPGVVMSSGQIPQYDLIRNSSKVQAEVGDFIFTLQGATIAAAGAPSAPVGKSRGADAPAGAAIGLGDPYDKAAALNEEKQYTEAAALFEKSCGIRNVKSCNAIGYMYFNGIGVDKDQEKALGFYKSACNGNNPAGCTNLGFMYGTGAVVAKDEAKAAPLYQKGCNAGNAPGCRNLALFYASGPGRRC